MLEEIRKEKYQTEKNISYPNVEYLAQDQGLKGNSDQSQNIHL